MVCLMDGGDKGEGIVTQSLTTRQDKTATLDEIEHILERHIIVGLRADQRAQIREHMAWLRRQPGTLRVNCKLETLPHLRSTRIHLELSYDGIPGFDTKESQEA